GEDHPAGRQGGGRSRPHRRDRRAHERGRRRHSRRRRRASRHAGNGGEDLAGVPASAEESSDPFGRTFAACSTSPRLAGRGRREAPGEGELPRAADVGAPPPPPPPPPPPAGGTPRGRARPGGNEGGTPPPPRTTLGSGEGRGSP